MYPTKKVTLLETCLSMPASDDFFLDRPGPCHVHDQGRGEAAQVESMVEPVGKGCEIGLGVLAELQRLEGFCQGRLEVSRVRQV